MENGEIPSANVMASARGLARLGACVVEGGELDGVRVMSREGCERMQGEFKTARTMGSCQGVETSFSRGGLNLFGYVTTDDT